MISIRNILSVQNRTLFAQIVRTDFKLRYQGSALGYLWSLLKPLFIFGILYVVFSKFLRFGESVPYFAVSLLLGMILWTFFTEATQSSLTSIVDRGELIRKVKVPYYLIPASRVASAAINLGLSLIVVFAFALLSGVKFGMSALLFPLILLELVIIVLAISFFLAAAYVRFRDISYIWEVVLQGVFFLVPIIYPLAIIPNELARKFIVLNPIAQVIQDAKAVLIYPETTQLYDLLTLPFWGITFGLVLLAVLLSILLFRQQAKSFAENI